MGTRTLSPDPLVGTHYEFEVSVACVTEESSDLSGTVGMVHGEVLCPRMPRTNRTSPALDCQQEVIITRRETITPFEIVAAVLVNHLRILH